MTKHQDKAAKTGVVTLRQFVENGLGLRPFCACGRVTVIPPEHFAGLPLETTLEAFKARLKCAACGRIGIETAHVVSMSALSAYPHVQQS